MLKHLYVTIKNGQPVKATKSIAESGGIHEIYTLWNDQGPAQWNCDKTKEVEMYIHANTFEEFCLYDDDEIFHKAFEICGMDLDEWRFVNV